MISVPVRRIKWNWGIQFWVQFFKIINCLILVLNSETSSKNIRPSSESIKTRALRPELESCRFQTSKPGNCPTMISTLSILIAKTFLDWYMTCETIELLVKSHPVFGPAFTPYPLFQWYPQSKEILLNLRHAEASRVIIVVGTGRSNENKM